jgi:hypothetical protein
MSGGRMNKLLLALLVAVPLFAQQKLPVSSLQEDCGVTFAFTVQSSGVNASGTVINGSPGTTPVIDNTQAGCLDWLVTYSTTTTVTGLSLLFQTATNLAGVPGTWSAYGGTLNSGINPNTAFAPPWAITDATGNKYPFLRMNLTSKTGAGTVSGHLYGWKRRPNYVAITSGGGCPGTVGTPCVVIGPNAAGVAPGFAPVLVAGENGTPGTVQIFRLDSAGLTPIAISAPGTAMANILAYPTTPTGSQSSAPMAIGAYRLNPGSGNLDQEFICTQQAHVTLTDGTLTALVAVSGTTSVHVCHIHFSTTAPETITISQGTGTACAGAPATLDKYLSTQSLAMDWQPTAALRTSASNGLCIQQSAAQAAELLVIYAQF